MFDKTVSTPLNKQIIVITGASSGVGRATALEFARYRCTLVIAARQKNELDEVAGFCRQLGASVLAVQTDVSNFKNVEELAVAAVNFGGKIDVWVNIAGIAIMGEYNAAPMAEQEQVIKTNLLGCMYGAYAVIPQLKKQQSGVIINMNSVGAYMATPYSAAYSTSKFGMRGFSGAIRAELSKYPDIYVCDLFPAFLDTPGSKHAGNYLGKVIKPVPPVIPTTKIARTIVGLAVNPQNQTSVNFLSAIVKLGGLVMPQLSQYLMAKGIEAYQTIGEDAPQSSGNILFPTGTDNQISGGYTSKNITAKKAKMIAGIASAALGLLFLTHKIRN